MTITRTFDVVVTKRITVHLPDSFATQEFQDEWRAGLWDIDGIDDIAAYAAGVAFNGGGTEEDGLGLVNPSWSKHPREPDVKFDLWSEDTETFKVKDFA